MKKTEETPKKKPSLLVGLIAVIVLLFGGYFGNSVIDNGSNGDLYSQNQPETDQDQNRDQNQNQDQVQDSDQAPQEAEQQQNKTYYFRSEKLWQQHYEKHGIEMGFDSPEDYLLAANKVIGNENVLHKLEAEDGDDVYYLEETNEFVIVSVDGYLRTYFNPNDGINYFNRQ